jgi:hypothetical protein
MSPKVKLALYGLSAFVIFALITALLRVVSGKIPENPDFFGVFVKNDIWLGIVVALVIMVSRNRKLNDKQRQQ